jgi:murein DD-endopeptidase MepM/ murein hydrolase activator NlpD
LFKKKYFFAFIVGALILSGCATVPYATAPGQPSGAEGFYHRMEKGQTLWRISKIYNVELDELLRINRISDATNIETGQLILVPRNTKNISPQARYLDDDFIWPVKGRVISGFGQPNNNIVNKGIDIQPFNNLNVLAARGGKVVFCAQDFGVFGITIIIDHGDGFSTVYSRNSEVLIKVGDNVQKGAVISKVGSAGRSKGQYLHFEIRKGYIPQNPSYYLSS